MNIVDSVLRRLGYVKHQGDPPFRRSYSAAVMNRLSQSWKAPVSSADTETLYALRVLRARSRELERNNDYAKKFLSMCVTNIVGPRGIILQNRAKNPDGSQDRRANEIIEAAWEDFGKKGICTVDGQMSLLEAQSLFVKTVARDGEILVRKVRGFDNKFRYALQFIEGDHLDETYNVAQHGGNEIRMGVELDPWGRPLAYYLRRAHPGDYSFNRVKSAYEYERIPAEDIIHAFIRERPRQTRGTPWMHSAMTRLNMVGEYEDAELVAARVGASKMGFFTKSEQNPISYMGDDKDEKGNIITEAEPGTFEALPPGYDFKSFDPDHPVTNYGMFIKCVLRGVSSGLGISYNSLASDLEGVNYSSLRDGKIEERDNWRILQSWMIGAFLNEVFGEWLRFAMLTGNINLPNEKYDKFNAPKWQPRGWQWVDPQKDQDASVQGINQGLKTRTAVCAEQGEDFEDLLDQLVLEQKMIEDKGAVIAPGQPKAAPKTDPKTNDGGNANVEEEDNEAEND